MIQEAIYEVIHSNDLSFETMRAVMNEMMEGKATHAQMGAFLAAMRMKGETIDEITACATVMREKCTKIHPNMDVLDIVGTGGDEANTFNISTISSFVVAAGGIPVAKHGNRSVSSKCGSADVLEALNVNIELSAQASQKILEEIGICFIYAPVYHASMKYAAPVRKDLKIRTIFNILGSLANPAGANLQLLGVYDENLVEPMARVLANLGVKRAMVVHGHDGLDEVTLCTTSTICEVNQGRLNSFFLTPEQVGLMRCEPMDLVGGSPKENAQIAMDILNGVKGPKRDVVVLNAAICLYMSHDQMTLRDCVKLAESLIDSKKAKEKLEKLIRLSHKIEKEGES